MRKMRKVRSGVSKGLYVILAALVVSFSVVPVNADYTQKQHGYEQIVVTPHLILPGVPIRGGCT